MIKVADTCFIRIPKTGSQALLYFLQANSLVEYCNNSIVGLNGHSVAHQNNNQGHLTYNDIISQRPEYQHLHFIGVVRSPHEKLLSTYLYRHIEGKYESSPSIEDFRLRIEYGGIDSKLVHLIPQWKYFEDCVNFTVWNYDTFETSLMQMFPNSKEPLKQINYKNNAKKWVDKFYDSRTLDIVKERYQRDYQLIEHNSS